MIGFFPQVMELGSLRVTAPRRRRLSTGLRVEGSVFRCVLVLACTIFWLATCNPCLLNSMRQSAGNDACGRCVDDRIAGSEDRVAADTGFELAGGGSMSICANPQLLCFPSTLTGSLIGKKMLETAPVNDRPDCSVPAGSAQDNRWGNSTWPSGMAAKSVDFGEDLEQPVEVFGQDHASLSQCPRHTDNQTGVGTKNSGMKKSPPVDVHPPVLDWGEKHIHTVSLALLTVANTCNKSILTVYEPFSSNSQFYPCNFSGVSLEPGQIASLCFVFTPRSLGFTSGQVVLQTSYGGFFIEVKGLAVENSESDNKIPISDRSSAQFSSSIKARAVAEADEFVLESWKSRGTSSTVPMKASLPLYMLNICWKSLLWAMTARLRKYAGALLLAAFVISLVIFCVSPRVTDYGYQDHSQHDDKTSPVAGWPRDRSRSKFSASPHLDSLLSSPGKDKSSKDSKHPKSRVPAQEQIVHNESPETRSAAALQPCNLTIRIGKEKGRRRRKRRGPNGVLNVIEVSSSHSGNSTPSSPMSPLASTTPSSSWSSSQDMDHPEARSPFGRPVESKATLHEPKASMSHRTDENLSASSERFTSRSTIAPYARAPGSKLCNRKSVSVEDKVGDEYRYDIWGDHLSRLNATSGSKDVHAMEAAVTKSDSNSFFVRGPQALMGGKSQPKYVSCFRPEG